MSDSPLFVLAGGPAAGKSTIARALADRFSQSTHLDVDSIREAVRSGLALPTLGEWPDAVADQVGLARLAALDVARRYRDAGFVIVIDDFLDPLLLREYDDVASDRAVVRAILCPDVEVAIARNRARPTKEAMSAEMLDGAIRFVGEILAESGEALAGRGWVMVDNTQGTVVDAVDQLLALVHS